MFVQCITLFMYDIQLYKLSTYNFIDENPHNLTPRLKMVTLWVISYLRKISHPKQLFQRKMRERGEREVRNTVSKLDVGK